MRVYRYLTSVGFFLVVGGMLAVFIGLTSVIPQGLAGDEYAARLGRAPAIAMLLLGLDDFYRSPLFFLLGALLELNLLGCTVPRFRRRIAERRSGSTRALAFAPDTIHAGLAVLILSFIIGAAVREEHQFSGFVGDEFSAGEQTFHVVNAQEVKNEKGILVSWAIELEHEGDTRRLAVNQPIALGGYRLHFRRYERVPVALLTAPKAETTFELSPEEALTDARGALLRFDTVRKDGSAMFILSVAGSEPVRIRVHPGEDVAGLTYRPGGPTTAVGFSATRNPARPALLAGFVLVAVGLTAYAIDKGRAHG